ncbi:LysR family transcriptional regulator [Variovorax sp. J31P207]|uniref:LysR family transcriptional regulator n=1 Tax=Variovorax sp. J31P207 TaxID=3053510 RepID=UPI002577985A|nr:LysR family transcriptional regulator [Variovorax sp. J31P207]MDM0069954.1 LysR family transcriptional regulator [Variovorax sp. J31P207]
MSRITLLNLETLCCIANVGTFAAAAEKMHASQPAISARIRDMEATMGVALFRRQGRRMELTSHGRELVAMVEPLLHRLQGAVGSIDNPASMTGTVRFGAGEYAALSWFPTFMSRLHERMPRVNYQVDVDLTASLTEKLKAGKLDVALLAGPIVGSDIRSVSVGRVRMIWAAAPGLVHSLPASMPPKERLMTQSIWSLSSPSASHTMTQSILHELEVTPDGISTCNHTMALIELILAGAGIALLPEILARGYLAKSELVPVLPGLPSPEIEFVIAWQGALDQPLIRTVVELARSATSFDLAAIR